MRVLVACECSGRVRDAFAARGHDAWSCDLKPSEVGGKHLVGDARAYLDDGWDLLIAHPPCTYLTNACAHLWSVPSRQAAMQEAASLFMDFYNAPIPRVCIENPRGIMSRWFRPSDQEVHPYYFGEAALKRTALWLRGLPPLFWSDTPMFKTAIAKPAPIAVDSEFANRPGKRRYFVDTTRDPAVRSRTFSAVAAAMADQWG